MAGTLNVTNMIRVIRSRFAFGFEECLCQKHWMLLWRNTQLVVEGVVAILLHIIPIRFNSMLDRVLESQNATLALRLVADVAVLLVHAKHNTWPPLRHPFTIRFRIQRCHCQKHWMHLWRNSQLVVEGVVANLFHTIPIR